ncbi:MAG: sn-glycerol-3-phosphate ABC transporter ATP-binding protein UgpC [Pirellulales bacterium]|nr:sn-glycerol-3-phosphate ABC transporter ATP-binding protein UgpC [Pirellulales bacterium]
MATVSFRNVNKRYPNGYHAVCDLNLEIADGEFVVLVGPSGCGKSTTLRMLAGLEEITSGEVLIGSRVVNDVEPGRRDIAMVFQNYALYPHMTVRQNLAFGLKMRRTPKAEIARRTADVAETLGITTLLDRRPRELSGGQRQRVALGRAIVRQPQVFLFDEPLSNLDAKLRVQMRAEIAALHQRLKTTMIYVTHDQVEAMTLGQRIVVMDLGVVQQADAPLAIYQNPANRFVAGFIGSPPMNFVHGRLAGACFLHPAGEVSLTNGDAPGGRDSFAAQRGRDSLATGELTSKSEPPVAKASRSSVAAPPVAKASRPLSADDPLPSGSAILGVRPEDLALDAAGPPLAQVTLEVVEQMGHESMGYFSLAGQRCAMRLPANSGLAAGDRVEPRLRPGSWRLFADDPQGRRLL